MPLSVDRPRWFGCRACTVAALVLFFPFQQIFPAEDPNTGSHSGTSDNTHGSMPSAVFLYSMDLFVPGGGSFYTGRYLRGSFIAAGRILTVASAVQSRRYAQAYRSAEQAARAAELLYGPGFRYKNPYGPGYHSAEEFRHKADRYIFYSSLSISFHVMLTAVSLYVVGSDRADQEAGQSPVFDAFLMPDGQGRGGAAALSLHFRF